MYITCIELIVHRHLSSINLLMEAALLLDNCPGHLSTEKLCSEDGNIFTMFRPPNTTPIIQLIDQNVIQNIKFNYRKLYFQTFCRPKNMKFT